MSARLLLTIPDRHGVFTHYTVDRLPPAPEAPEVWRLSRIDNCQIGAIYDITQTEDGWRCDCAHAVMRPGRGPCRHLAAMMEKGILR